jgi:hypothetical protein
MRHIDRAGRPPGTSTATPGRLGPAQSGDGHHRRAAALVPLRRDDLHVERAHGEPERLPRVEVVAGRDRAAGAVRLADAPVLVERRRALDRGLVDARAFVDVVRAPVGGDGALVGEPAGRVVRAEVLGDVVLDERVRRPALDGEVRVAGRRVVGVERDGPARRHQRQRRHPRGGGGGARHTVRRRFASPCRRQSCRSSSRRRRTRRRWSRRTSSSRRWCRSRWRCRRARRARWCWRLD